MRRFAALAAVVLLAPALLRAAPAVPDGLAWRLAGGTVRLAPNPHAPGAPMTAMATPPAPDWFAIETAAREKSSQASSRRPESPQGRRYLVLAAAWSLGPGEREKLAAAGAEVLDYLPRGGYRVRLAQDREEAVRLLPFVAWLGDLPAHLKVAPELMRRAGLLGAPPTAAVPESAPTPAAAPIAIRVILAASEPPGRALEILRGLDVFPAPSGPERAWRVTAQVPAARLRGALARLAALPEVEAVEPARRLLPLNQDAVWVHQSFVGPSPQSAPIFDHGLFGCGQIVASADTGQDYGSCYFQDAVHGPPPVAVCAFAPCSAAAPALDRRKDILYYNWSGTPTGDDDFCPGLIGASGHGTHTTGSIAGDAPAYADCAAFGSPGRNGGDGQAPGARLVVQEMGDGLEYLNNRGGTVWNLADVAFQNGARIHSNSWGGACHDAFGACIPGCTLPYDSFARDADLAMWTHPDLLIVASAGNAGEFCPPPQALGMPANAKSVLSVGAVGHGSNAVTPSAFSSPGPVFDGRLKPEVAAQGEDTVSAASDASPASANCDSCALSGSSMSAPTVAGLAALVREYYAAGFYAAGSRAPAQGFEPSAALVKATLVDGAVAVGAAAPGPDFDSGYGRVLLGDTLAFAGSPFRLRADDHREGMTTGSVVTHAYDVAAGTPLRVTLVWSDFPAALNAATARVNELRLEVIDPSGTVWFQRLDPPSGLPSMTSDPAAPHDALNVTERLVFPNPVPGRWAVRVIGVDVPMGPQPFALLVRGDLTDCPAPAAPAAPGLSTPAEHQVQVSWTAVPGAQSYNVHRSLGSCPGGPWVLVAAGIAGTSFLDSGVSGGTPYSYAVTAASDGVGFCVSSRSGCASVVPTGDCTLPPLFGGLASATSAGTSTCSVSLGWNAALPYCGADVRYNVYRSTDPAFAPGPANRIARCVGGTSWVDAADLAGGASYHYVVRAEDATGGHGGACRDGNEESNTARLTAIPAGPATLGTFRDDGGDTGVAAFTAASPWTNPATGGRTGPRVYQATSDAGVCADLTSPTLTVGSPGLGPLLTFATRHTLDYDPLGDFGAEGSLGQVEIATGPSFVNWSRLPLSPDYPAIVEAPLNLCPTTADVDTYFSGTASYATYTASLANWGGSDVRIRFHLSGDIYLYPSGGWWIDDVQISNVLTPGACTTAAAGPPPIPDGASVPGEPLRAAHAGSAVAVTWDAGRCPAVAVNLYWGALGNGSTFTGGVCGLPATGAATVSLPDNVWFLVAATDGAATDGSWSRAPGGAERVYAGAGLVCPSITKHDTSNGCP